MAAGIWVGALAHGGSMVRRASTQSPKRATHGTEGKGDSERPTETSGSEGEAGSAHGTGMLQRAWAMALRLASNGAADEHDQHDKCSNEQYTTSQAPPLLGNRVGGSGAALNFVCLRR